MSSAPRSVQGNKRKKPAKTTPLRKRVRLSDDVASDAPASRRRQQTLTQIAFVQSPNTMFADDDLELDEISYNDNKENIRPPLGKRERRKTKSTLTQMNWLNGHLPTDERFDSDPLPNLHTTIEKKLELSSNTLNKRQCASPRQSSEPDHDVEQYSSAKGRKGSIGTSNDDLSYKRRSRRISSKLSIALRSLDQDSVPFAEQLPAIGPQSADGQHRRPRKRKGNKIHEKAQHLSGARDATTITETALLKTPHRLGREIPSSVSPEEQYESEFKGSSAEITSPLKRKTAVRTPLRDRTNVLAPITTGQRQRKSSVQSVEKLSPQRLLNFDQREADLPPRPDQVDDSQEELYSLQPTCTAIKISPRLTPCGTVPATSALVFASTQQPEIPESSQQQETSHSSPVPSALQPQAADPNNSVNPSHRYLTQIYSNDTGVRLQAPAWDGVEMHHPSGHGDVQLSSDVPIVKVLTDNAVEVSPEDEMLLEMELAQSRPATSLQEEIEDSEFGSPIANDTQFVRVLREEVSSPVLLQPQLLTTKSISLANFDKPGISTPSPLSTASHLAKDVAQQSQADGIQRRVEPAAPTPHLVRRDPSSLVTVERRDYGLGRKEMLEERDIDVQIKKVPLNDAAQSSPTNARSPRSTCSESLHPASMPRPSQMSTQEPTQRFLPSSMFQRDTVYEEDEDGNGEVDHIVIKDSSPPSLSRLSQIPKHEPMDSLFNGKDEIEDSDDDLEDLDLDSTSARVIRESARKAAARHLDKGESSLYSIHKMAAHGSEQHDPHGQESVPLSSPLIPTKKIPRRFETAGEVEATAQPNEDVPDLRSDDLDAGSDIVAVTVTASASPTFSRTSCSPKASSQLDTRHYPPIEGFNNETQSNFTQNGHVSAAYIHRMRVQGGWPEWFVPPPYQARAFREGGRKH